MGAVPVGDVVVVERVPAGARWNRTGRPAVTRTLIERVPSRSVRSSCRPGVQSLKSPTTETGSGAVGGSENVSW